MQQDTEVLSREAEHIITHVGIPPCPAILTKLVNEMRSEEPDFSAIGKLIGGDITLAGALLKTVNSPFYGLPTPATSVQQALALFGLRNVAQLITGLLLHQAFPVGASARMEEFWESSLGIAVICAKLARQVKGMDRDEAYTFGLFRDCGIPAMMMSFQDYVPPRTNLTPMQNACDLDLENEHYGINHALMGYHLAKNWLLPEGICQAVLQHHSYVQIQAQQIVIPQPCARLVALALVAERLFLGRAISGKCVEWNSVAGDFALSCLDVTAETLEAAVKA